MTSPPNATTAKSGQRFYSWRDEKYWSVTTILSGGLPKRALIYWAANEVAQFVCDNPQTVAELIQNDKDAAYDVIKRAPWRKKEKAGDLGTNVHVAVEAHALGKPMPPWSLEVRPYMRAFERFLADFNPVFEATEASVYNRTQRYAGTLDAISLLTLPLHDNRRRYVIDAKSGKDIYPEISLQLAAYRFAEFIGLPDGSEGPMPLVDGALALHLAPDRYRLIEVRADEEMFKAFLFVREVFRFIEETSKTVLGQEYANDVATVQEVA